MKGLSWIRAETKNTSKRVTQILMLDEDEVGIKNLAFENHSKKMFSCKNVRCAYPKVEDCALEKITFDLEDKEMMAVIGPVGAGKSSILNMALNDLEVKSGSMKSNMVVSLAPQEPWIFEGTVRENILLGKKFDEKRYQAVLDASCLDADIKLLGKFNYKKTSLYSWNVKFFQEMGTKHMLVIAA